MRSSSSRRSLIAAAAFAVAVGAALAGCGEDEVDAGGGPALKIADADRANFDLVVDALDIDFDQDHYDAAASDALSIAYVEKGEMIHSLLILDAAGSQVPITQTGGQTIALEIGPPDRLIVGTTTDATGTAPLAAGDYALICDIPGHAEAGMTATLTVS